jgi:hypothetical protein
LNKDYRKRLTAAQALSKFLKLKSLFDHPTYVVNDLILRCHFYV